MRLPLPLHPSRVQMLYALRHLPYMKYTELMRATGLESDVFKFHLRILVQNHLVAKNDDGSYSLTPSGKEFANNLDEATGQRDRSPKLSIVIVATTKCVNGDLYLFHQRRRNPFYGYWGLISGPVLWGRSIQDSAKDELSKQTGLSAVFRVHGFCRVRDYSSVDHTLLEDKLFAVIIADVEEQTTPHDWPGGMTRWMPRDAFNSQDKRFEMTTDIISHVQQGDGYFEIDNEYTVESY